MDSRCHKPARAPDQYAMTPRAGWSGGLHRAAIWSAAAFLLLAQIMAALQPEAVTAGRVSQLTQPGTGTCSVRYDGAGNQTALQAPNGTLQTWGCDGASRPLTTIVTLSGTTLFSQTDTLDAAGQRIAVADSWGHGAFSYDQAGRLVGASYPDGSGELDQYDGVGNRTVITSTVTLSGTSSISTTVTTNQYDAADELTGSAAQTVGVQGPPQPTAYSYDANGNQLGSVGPSGAITNTYDLRNELVQVLGPSTNVTYVYDGQGDRLRSLEQAGPVPVLHNYAQDLAAGMSDLLSDGQQDYAYLQTGSGQAPVSALNQATQRSAYLGTDLLGSVRLVTDPTGVVIGAGAYDAWGNARPDAGSAGASLLAGLEESQPFGLAGQYLDAGAGTYDMRAREYNPAQGLFQSKDPHAYDSEVPVTLDPYEYAGQVPTDLTDPSGQWWLQTARSLVTDLVDSAVDGDIITRLYNTTACAQGTCGTSSTGGQGASAPPNLQFAVAVIHTPDCTNPEFWFADLVDLQDGYLWDYESSDVYNPGATRQALDQLVYDAWNYGYVLPQDMLRSPRPVHHAHLTPGPQTIGNFTLGNGSNDTTQVDVAQNNWPGGGELRYWWQEPGVILWHDHGNPCISLAFSDQDSAKACAAEEGMPSDGTDSMVVVPYGPTGAQTNGGATIEQFSPELCSTAGTRNIVVPIHRGWACPTGSGLPQNGSLVMVRFDQSSIAGFQLHHSMLFITGGQGDDFLKWELTCEGDSACPSPLDSGPGTGVADAHCHNESDSAGERDGAGASAFAGCQRTDSDLAGTLGIQDHSFNFSLAKPADTANRNVLLNLANNIDARGLRYNVFTLNCHTFTHSGLTLLGLQPPPEAVPQSTWPWVTDPNNDYGVGWDDSLVGYA